MKKNNSISVNIFSVLVSLWGLLLLSSCGNNGNINPVEAKIQYQVLNLSYDILPVNLYVNYLKQNSSSIRYPSGSGYIGLTTIDTPFQIRSAQTNTTVNLLKIDSTKLSRDTKYTVYIVGSRKDSTLDYIFTVDTSRVPAVGKGKVRFVNAAPQVTGADSLTITANDVVAFSKKYKGVSDYIELTSGMYNFVIHPNNNLNQTLVTLPNTTIQDGRLYTIYTYGLAFRTDTTAFNAQILNNR
ncbi:DUF4397 domain-containing protein [Mucilaginibacter limnophilus]|uniref:DUF4397 domain-containing protein n=1 Tax=Mucilaginibacter limnophilus TaxID=1932778 RepID=A0A437MRC9_9SPHI|nr:DUF4397 domain-containing protein [Mucilaginibacter limnophilus]RVU00207.1 DUF4397 domain-containing protein [Mucilaginibacter limnophilus]